MKGNKLMLILILIMVGLTIYNTLQIEALSYENNAQWSYIDSMQAKIVNTINTIDAIETANNKSNSRQKNVETGIKAKPEKPVANVVTGNTNWGTETKNTLAIDVKSKYRIDDRYVERKVELPEYKGDQTGELVIDIKVDWLGNVQSAKVRSSDGITDEDVIDACKKAVLKTDFNSNQEHYGIYKTGTITYIFTAE